jgi:hypothetical protein
LHENGTRLWVQNPGNIQFCLQAGGISADEIKFNFTGFILKGSEKKPCQGLFYDS